MKNLYLISFLFIFIVSCEKEETVNSDIPEWLEPRIEELENSDLCEICSISKSIFQNKPYYHVFCGHWSCINCEVYDSTGKLVDWSEIDIVSFAESQKESIIIWSCPNSNSE